MKVYYDTEFWERGPGHPIEFISIGMVAGDGRELYLINSEAPIADIAGQHPWLRDNVLNQLPVKLRRTHTGAWNAQWIEDHPDAEALWTRSGCTGHYGFPRALSVRESARLQSFPDHFVFTTDPRRGTIPGRIDGGAAHSRYRQVGNAVPPLLAAGIARQVARLVQSVRAASNSGRGTARTTTSSWRSSSAA